MRFYQCSINRQFVENNNDTLKIGAVSSPILVKKQAKLKRIAYFRSFPASLTVSFLCKMFYLLQKHSALFVCEISRTFSQFSL